MLGGSGEFLFAPPKFLNYPPFFLHTPHTSPFRHHRLPPSQHRPLPPISFIFSKTLPPLSGICSLPAPLPGFSTPASSAPFLPAPFGQIGPNGGLLLGPVWPNGGPSFGHVLRLVLFGQTVPEGRGALRTGEGQCRGARGAPKESWCWGAGGASGEHVPRSERRVLGKEEKMKGREMVLERGKGTMLRGDGARATSEGGRRRERHQKGGGEKETFPSQPCSTPNSALPLPSRSPLNSIRSPLTLPISLCPRPPRPPPPPNSALALPSQSCSARTPLSLCPSDLVLPRPLRP